jgi:hypothetical protein
MTKQERSLRPQINRKLREKLHELNSLALRLKHAGNDREKRVVDLKIRLLAEVIAKRRDPDFAVADPSVFISYSKSGSGYFSKAKKLCEERGYTVNTGFDDQSADYVLKVIKNKIKESTMFLSIMTPEHKFDPALGTEIYAPSVWLPEEKGMALVLEKPFRLLVHSKIKSEFWKQTTPSQLHTIFNDAEFPEKLDEAVSALDRRYQEILETQLQEFARKVVGE